MLQMDPCIREASGVKLRGSVVIFDEGHNIEDVARCGRANNAALPHAKCCIHTARLGLLFALDLCTVCCSLATAITIRGNEAR